ncbi:3-oxoacyl-ACP reductase FabG [Dyella tabacisoli]|uniref:3-oxoacyl-ACP reductase FabG n=1 Tax=Dyella tabacisoli TaxID=2282381 RepID=A0A369ULA6_9GAMM|nr:3-oxoacyl-ACP reductase FabG [Dyella tabacisoli]RDD81311.1 3-oxoacyl-ACP reductase FabG [Dyella tabacisoli]
MQTALVTGGSGDIGAAICLQLAKQGLLVYVHAHKNPEKAEAVARQIRKAGGKAQVIVFDINDTAHTQQLLSELSETTPIDVLVNNAGTLHDAPMAGMEFDAWSRIVNTTLHGFFNVTKPLLMPMIRKRKGRIINMSSVAGITGVRGQTNYAAAKSGLHGATKSLAHELANRNITVNAVAPGVIDGGMAKGKFDAALLKAIVPMQRAGRVEEVSALVGFLASDAASYITGQIISVNGGMA